MFYHEYLPYHIERFLRGNGGAWHYEYALVGSLAAIALLIAVIALRE